MSKRKNNYDNWSKENLIKELRRIKETKYGLVWHRDLPEEKIDTLINPDARTPNEMFPNEMAGKPFPILKEVKDKELNNDKGKPVNLLIEGDNYHSLAVLNFTHFESIDCIYIDPPYNKGNDGFIYNDKRVDKEDSFIHSKWLSFMEKRLKLAKNLLKPTGVIFISIDDNEQAPLKMLCDEIFGEENFVTNFVWKTRQASGKQVAVNNISVEHEYILCYRESNTNVFKGVPRNRSQYTNPDNDPRGDWAKHPLDVGSTKEERHNCFYDLIDPATGNIFHANPNRVWAFAPASMNKLISEEKIIFDPKGKNRPYLKKFWTELRSETKPISTWIGKVDDEEDVAYLDVGYNTEGTKLLNEMFGDKRFDYPKPLRLLKTLISQTDNKDSVILDFMAGSGTTGHAVLELNKEDGGNRQFILCTNNENNICTNVCYPRLKKAINGYKNTKGENVKGLGGNLKYYTCDFVDAEPTDRNKQRLVSESTEMLCIRENAFELVEDGNDFKIYRNSNKYLGIVFYEEAIGDFKKMIKKIKGHFNTYVFSLGDDPHEKQFADVKEKVILCAIPEVILKVYREIFK